MIIFNPGEIILIDVPFSDQSNTKHRPALVLFDEHDDDVILARITTIYRPDKQYDYKIKDLTSAGLPVQSYVRLSKVFTLHKNKVVRVIGKLESEDRKAINDLLEKIFRI